MKNKIITISYFAAGGNTRGSTFNNQISTVTGWESERKDCFKEIKESIKSNFEEMIKNSSPCTGEIRYYFSISICDIKKEKVTFKIFKIDPKNLR